MSDKLVFDTPGWRELRNQKLMGWLRDENAVLFLLDVFNIAEVWDDLTDKDRSLSNIDIHKAFYTAMIALPANPFYQAYHPQLSGCMVSGIHAWLDANELEKGDEHDKSLAFVLRDWYMELLTLVCQLLHGFDYTRAISLDMRRFFAHEDLNIYKENLR